VRIETEELTRKRLLAIYEPIAARARATEGAHPWWPCRRGCDGCCRRLAEEPRITRAEWDLLREGLDALAPEVRAEVDARIRSLGGAQGGGHVVCPMLDPVEGACLVYAHRPAACRTYGFYVERDEALACDLVMSAVDAHEDGADVVWGNQESVDASVASVSAPALPLSEWAGREGPRNPSSSM
jgi:Fe-S-cluster containining protein